MNNRLINTKVAGGGGGCTDIVDNYDPFGGNGVALYQLNGNANDVSENYNGNFVSPAYTTGVFGQAASLSGTNYIDIPTLPDYRSGFAFSSWVLSDTTQNKFIITQKGTGEYANFAYRLSSGKISLITGNGTSAYYINYTQPTALTNGWHHIVVTGTASSITIYVDGAFLTTQTGTAFINSSNMQHIMGVNYYNGSIDTVGAGAYSLDQFRFFNTALDPLEVEALYTEELCICDGTVDTLQVLGDTSCIATYQLDGNANDLSGNYSGQATNVSYGVGEFDLSGVFNGTSSIISNTVGATAITSFSMWVKINDTNTAQIIQTFGNNNYLISVYLGKLNVQYAATSTSGIGWTITNQSNWHHIAGTITSSSATLYVDGQQKTDAFADYFNGLSVPCIGDRDGGGGSFNGSIDQVRIFNKALNSTEVETLWLESACTYGGRQSEGTQILGDSSCIAYYKLDGTAEDETGTYNGAFTTPNYANGEFLYAGVFNGSSSSINTNFAQNTSNAFSWSLWFNANSSQNGLALIIDTTSNVSPYPGVGIGLGGNTELAAFVSGTTFPISTTITSNTWVHVVYTNDGSGNFSFYVNGVAIFTNASQTTNIYSGQNILLGNTTTWNKFKGSIDQVRIFNKAVSPSEVTTLYNEGI